MAEMMQFNLVSPERRLASVQARSVLVPGVDGDMTVMPDHAPVITTLRPGVIVVEGENGTQEFVVTGGFAEIGETLSVLAENALPKGDVTQADMSGFVAAAREAAARAAAGSASDAAAKLVADFEALAGQIGLTAA